MATTISSADQVRAQWALSLIHDMIRDNAYGQLQISFEDGRIVHAKDCRSRKPGDDDA